MNIIVVSNTLGKSRTISLSKPQAMMAAGLIFVLLPLMLTLSLYYFSLQHAAKIKSPYLQAIVAKAQQQEMSKNHAYLQDNLSALALKLGQMQAQLLRLDALGERLAKTAGFKSQEFNFERQPAQGGPLLTPQQGEFSLLELQARLVQVAQHVDDRADQLAILEAMISQESQKKTRLPTAAPVSVPWRSSDFGWRIDPFTGAKAFHEGVDFTAETGMPIKAAAGGVVVYSDYHAEYGNMLEIDHGNGLVSRYAHASKRLVKVGDVVMKGQEIARVGSTGRSTGPHLHFEVRFKGAPQNPARFLQASN